MPEYGKRWVCVLQRSWFLCTPKLKWTYSRKHLTWHKNLIDSRHAHTLNEMYIYIYIYTYIRTYMYTLGYSIYICIYPSVKRRLMFENFAYSFVRNDTPFAIVGICCLIDIQHDRFSPRMADGRGGDNGAPTKAPVSVNAYHTGSWVLGLGCQVSYIVHYNIFSKDNRFGTAAAAGRWDRSSQAIGERQKGVLPRPPLWLHRLACSVELLLVVETLTDTDCRFLTRSGSASQTLGPIKTAQEIRTTDLALPFDSRPNIGLWR